jgi:hypothetical protein
MENRLDELFKNKLEHHTTTLSANTWKKIEMNLTTKNSPVVVWRMVAVFVLMGSLLYAIYWMKAGQTDVEMPGLVKENTIVADEKPLSVEKLAEEKSHSLNPIKQKMHPVQKEARTGAVAKVVTADRVKSVSIETPEAALDGKKIEITLKDVTTTEAVSIQKPIVLEFTLTPIETIIATTDERSTGLKRFFTKAKEIKNGERGLDLGEFTSRLFASTIKQDKDNIN